MASIKIDDHEYDIATLSENARQQLQMLQYVESEISRLSAQSAVLQTARIAYTRALKEAVEVPPAALTGDTIKFG